MQETLKFIVYPEQVSTFNGVSFRLEEVVGAAPVDQTRHKGGGAKLSTE